MYEVEPGAATESIFVTSDGTDNYEQMSSSLEEIKKSIIYNEENETNKENYEEINQTENEESDDLEINSDWLAKHKHVFVLSSAGKPIYSRYKNYFIYFTNLQNLLIKFVTGTGMKIS